MTPELEARSVVVPVDASPDSFYALLGSVGSLGTADRLHIVHVVPLPLARGPRGDAARHRRVTTARRLLSELIEAWGIPHARPVILEGAVGPAVTRFAAAVSADAIVVPVRRRPGADRFMVGPAAEQIVNLATCPVFLHWCQRSLPANDAEAA